MQTGLVLSSWIRWVRSLALMAGSIGVLLITMPGCDKDRDDSPAAASAVAPAPRPAVLTAAADEIRAGKPAEAHKRLKAFLEQQPESSYRPEALYLSGQALAAQGDYKEGKKLLEKAIDTAPDRSLKALAMLGRADCNMAMGDYSLASRQYEWLETMYRTTKALPQDELLFKLGMAAKKAGNEGSADSWFKEVIELYSQSPYCEKAKRESSKYTPTDPSVKPLVYTLEVESFGKVEKAEAEAAILRKKGYRDVEVIHTTINSIPVYEVHVGKFESKSAATLAQTDAELAGLSTKIRPGIIEPMK